MTLFRAGVILFLVLSGAFLSRVQAVPLKEPGVEQFRKLIDAANEPRPEPDTAIKTLTDYRRTLFQAIQDLPSLDQVAGVLLLPDWTATEPDIESLTPLDKNAKAQVEKAVRTKDDQSFQRAFRKLLAMSPADPEGATRAVVDEIKLAAHVQLLERLENRLRYYLRTERGEDRIAAAYLVSATMSASRRNLPGAEIIEAQRKGPPMGENVTPSARQLRQRLQRLGGDLRKLIATGNPQQQIAGLRALSDLEIPPTEMADDVKKLLASSETSATVRQAAANALGHVLEVSSARMDRGRPKPPLQMVEQLLPVAGIGLGDNDASVRQASLAACQQAAQILDELSADPQLPQERRTRLFRPAVQVVLEVMPKIHAVSRDPVPDLRVGACRVLETLVLASMRVRFRGERRKTVPTPQYLPSPVAPEPKKPKPKTKGVALPPSSDGWQRVSAVPSPSSIVSRPSSTGKDEGCCSQLPVAMPVSSMSAVEEDSEPAVTLGQPIKLPDESAKKAAAANPVTAVAFAQKVDDLPAPTPVRNPWQSTVQSMIRDLSDPDYRVRLAALDVVETLGDQAEQAVPALVKALKDYNKFVRWASARTLGRFGERAKDGSKNPFLAEHIDEIVTGLMGLLNDNEDPSVRITAAGSLEEYGETAKKAVPHLARVINRGNKEYIIAILHTIQGIGTDAAPALPNVAWLLSDRTQPPSVRIEAAQTLGRFGALARNQPRVLPVLRDIMLNDPDEAIRNAASTAILAIDRP